MDEPIEEAYFNWLYTKVLRTPGNTPSNSYQSLIFALHSTPYQWLVSGDDNRAADGIDLRYEFLNLLRIDSEEVDQEWLDLECSVLEMLIAFARRCSFQTALDDKEWFWIFLTNLNLSEISDGSYREYQNDIYPIISTFVGREYDRHGRGGLFPMPFSRKDQRRIEVWYQFSEYLVENNIP